MSNGEGTGPTRLTRKKTARKKRIGKKSTVRRGAKAWTESEIRRLRAMFKTHTAPEIAKALRRTLASIKGKIRVLGLKKGKLAKRRIATKRKAASKKKSVSKKRSKKKVPRKKSSKKGVQKKTSKKGKSRKRRH